MKKIQLKPEHRGKNSTTFTGRPQGVEIRKILHLSNCDETNDQFEISVPAGTTSFNPSFYLGLFFDSIVYLKGIENFKKKYKIVFEDSNSELVEIIKDDIRDCERQASNEYKRKIK